MKKVIKPSKQPTKKQSQRSQRSVRSQRNTNTAKLKKAIGKIAAQLVKDHPKLVKGGGSSGITDLIFSKNLMKGGEINDELRGDIVKFLKDSAPKVNKLKKDLLIKLIEYILDIDKSARGGDLELQMNSLNVEFKKGVYAYQLNIEEPYIKKLKDNNKKDIYDDFLILDIVGRFFTLSRINGDIPEEISNVKFKELSVELLNALSEYDQGKSEEKKNEIQALLEEYKKDGTEAVIVGRFEDDTESKKVLFDKLLIDVINMNKNNDIVERIESSVNFVFEKEGNPKIKLNEGKEALNVEKAKALKELNELYTKLEEKNKKINTDIQSLDGKSDLDKLQALEKLIEEFNELCREKYNYYAVLDIIEKVVPPEEVRDIEIVDDTDVTPTFGVPLRDGKQGEKDGGGNPTKYKSTGQVVNIMYKKRKYKRTIFVKEKRKTKYCKINNEYILLSKLNVL